MSKTQPNKLDLTPKFNAPKPRPYVLESAKFTFPHPDNECPVCRCVYIDPVICTSCGNTFCSGCAETQTKCPLCNKDDWTYVPNRSLGCVVAGYGVICPYRCNIENLTFGALLGHCEKDCPYIPCRCTGCDTIISPLDVEEHSKICPGYPVECTAKDIGCDTIMPRSELAHHVGSCDNARNRETILNTREITRLHGIISELTEEIRKLKTEITHCPKLPTTGTGLLTVNSQGIMSCTPEIQKIPEVMQRFARSVVTVNATGTTPITIPFDSMTCTHVQNNITYTDGTVYTLKTGVYNIWVYFPSIMFSCIGNFGGKVCNIQLYNTDDNNIICSKSIYKNDSSCPGPLHYMMQVQTSTKFNVRCVNMLGSNITLGTEFGVDTPYIIIQKL
jgi:hypothetical protein